MYYYLYVITVFRLVFFKVNPNCDVYSFILCYFMWILFTELCTSHYVTLFSQYKSYFSDAVLDSSMFHSNRNN